MTYLLVDSRSTVGGFASFWGPNSSGYTNDASVAQTYSRREAFEQNRSRHTDIPMPRFKVLERAIYVVDAQTIKAEDLNNQGSGPFVRIVRGFKGNAVLFESVGGGAPTPNLAQAARYMEPGPRGTVWRLEYLQALQKPMVDAASLSLQWLGKDAKKLKKAPKPVPPERLRCHQCKSFMSQQSLWTGACPRCKTDNRP